MIFLFLNALFYCISNNFLGFNMNFMDFDKYYFINIDNFMGFIVDYRRFYDVFWQICS